MLMLAAVLPALAQEPIDTRVITVNRLLCTDYQSINRSNLFKHINVSRYS